MSNADNHNYKNVLPDEEALSTFLRAMSAFEQAFCRCMNSKADFTLRMEIHGANSNLIHCRVNDDSFHRPSSKGSKSQKPRFNKAG